MGTFQKSHTQIEEGITAQCAKLASAIHNLKPPKDHDKHMKAMQGAVAAKLLGIMPAVLQPHQADLQYEKQLQQHVASFAQCGQRYSQGRPGVMSARDWLFNNIQEKDVASLKQVEAVFGGYQQARQQLSDAVYALSEDKIHQQSVHGVLAKYFFEPPRPNLPPKQP
jgi:hypothetical protein